MLTSKTTVSCAPPTALEHVKSFSLPMLRQGRFFHAFFSHSLAHRHASLFCVAALFVSGFGLQAQAYSSNPVFELALKPEKADVKVLAISTVVRDSFGNQDVYVATIQLKGEAPRLATLIDTYPSYSKPIRRDVLRTRPALRMTLVRFPDRDSSGQDVFLTADPRNVFDPEVRAALAEQQSSIIPCFNVVHGNTRLAHERSQ